MDQDMDLIQLVDDDELSQQTNAAILSVVPDASSNPAVPGDDPFSSCLQAVADSEAAADETGSAARQLPSVSSLQRGLQDPPTVHDEDPRRLLIRSCFQRAGLSFGIMQIIVALVSAPIAIVSIVYCAYLSFIGHGIWTSVMCVGAGIASICVWSKNTLMRSVLNVTCSTLAAVCTIVMSGLTIYSSSVDADPENKGDVCGPRNVDVTFLLDMLLAILSMIQLIISVVNSALAFRSCHRVSLTQRCYSSHDIVLFDGVRCWTRGDLENAANASRVTGAEAPPPPYTLPPYTPPEMPPPYKLY